MKLTNSGFQRGYNPIVVEGDASDMNMDFGELLMEKGDTVSYNEPKECIYVLVTGKVTFRWADKEETVERKSCFHEDPILLHVPQNTAVELMCQSDKAEVSIQRTTNPKHFEPKLMKGEDLLCGSELRGAGLMNEASTRIVRTFLDRSNCPETNFFIGEVVSYPGKWSSFPPPIPTWSLRSTSISSCPKMATAMPRWETPFIKFTTMTPPAWPTA